MKRIIIIIIIIIIILLIVKMHFQLHHYLSSSLATLIEQAQGLLLVRLVPVLYAACLLVRKQMLALATPQQLQRRINAKKAIRAIFCSRPRHPRPVLLTTPSQQSQNMNTTTSCRIC
eukprot:GSA25T00011940001.1